MEISVEGRSRLSGPQLAPYKFSKIIFLLGRIDMTTSTIAQGRWSATRRCRYQNQDSDMTLAEGLAEYYAANTGKVLHPDDLSEESAELFRSHDMCHVIFGLDTTLADEAIADTRTLLSCDVGVRKYARYMTANPKAKAIFKEIGYLKCIWITVLAVPRILRATWEAWKMPMKWPWTPPPAFQHRTLSDLRQEFGILVI